MLENLIPALMQRGLRRCYGYPYDLHAGDRLHKRHAPPSPVTLDTCDSVYIGDLRSPGEKCPKCGEALLVTES